MVRKSHDSAAVQKDGRKVRTADLIFAAGRCPAVKI